MNVEKIKKLLHWLKLILNIHIAGALLGVAVLFLAPELQRSDLAILSISAFFVLSSLFLSIVLGMLAKSLGESVITWALLPTIFSTFGYIGMYSHAKEVASKKLRTD